MQIQLTTYDPSIFQELKEIAENSPPDLPENVLIGEPIKEAKEVHGLSAPEIITFAVTVGTSIAANLFSSWLYDKVKGRTSQLRINDRIVQITVTEIRIGYARSCL